VFVQVIQGQVADAAKARAALDRWARELTQRGTSLIVAACASGFTTLPMMLGP
jgi:hypothetical protein